MAAKYEYKTFASELAANQISIGCLSRFMACQVLLSRKSSIQDVPFELSQKIKLSIYDMIQSDNISKEVFFAILDLDERMQEIVDKQIGIFNKKGISVFKGLKFLNDDEYEITAAPYKTEFTRNVFNLIQTNVGKELVLRGVKTSFINFELESYLNFLAEKGLNVKHLEKQNESLIFEWSEYANYIRTEA